MNIRSLSSMFLIVNGLITGHHIDLFGLPETWPQQEVIVTIN